MGLPEILAGVLLGSLVLYALTAGADFGGGVWDLLRHRPARGRAAQGSSTRRSRRSGRRTTSG